MKINIENVVPNKNIFPILRKHVNNDNKHLIVLFFNRTHALVLEASANSGHKVGQIKEMTIPYDYTVWEVLTGNVTLEYNCTM